MLKSSCGRSFLSSLNRNSNKRANNFNTHPLPVSSFSPNRCSQKTSVSVSVSVRIRSYSSSYSPLSVAQESLPIFESAIDTNSDEFKVLSLSPSLSIPLSLLSLFLSISISSLFLCVSSLESSLLFSQSFYAFLFLSYNTHLHASFLYNYYNYYSLIRYVLT
jgi:hypothetical protein